MEEKEVGPVKKTIKSVADIKFWQFSYALVATIATAGGIGYAVYKHFNPTVEQGSKQELVIKHEYAERPIADKGEEKQTVHYSEVENPQPVDQKPLNNENNLNSASAKQQAQVSTDKNINSQQASIKQVDKEPEDDDVFGIVKNTSKTAQPTQEKQQYAKAVVIGESAAQTGATIKVKLYQDLEGENYLIAQTTISGTIKINNNRIEAEFKDKQGNKYYLCDKNGAIGLAFAEKIPDSFQVKLTNQNK